MPTTDTPVSPTSAPSGDRSASPSDRSPAQRTWGVDSIPNAIWALVSLTLAVVVWKLAVVVFGLSDLTLPPPEAVAVSIAENAGLLTQYGLVTLREIVIGFGLAVLVGTALALAIAFSKVFEKLVYPLLVLTQSVPKVAIAPLFLIWFGFGATTNALIALLVAVFPIILNTALGLTSLDPDYLRLARVMGGSPWRVFRYVRLPAALPNVFAGLKLGMTLATIGAVVGEFNAGQSGLGYLAQVAAGQLNTPLTFAAVTVLSLLGVALFYIIVAIERASIGWHPSMHSGESS